MSTIWQELHSEDSTKWENLLHPLHPWLRGEIIKYGELAQATYEAFNNDSSSESYGACSYTDHTRFDELYLTKHGYQVTKYIYGMSHVKSLHRLLSRTLSQDSNWIGFVAVSTDEESKRIGRRDIVMAWRGTVAPAEWISDLEVIRRERFGSGGVDGDGDGDGKEVKVAHGFHKIYKCKRKSTRFNDNFSASEQVMEEVERFDKLYRWEKGEKAISFTITGHSLGGALALLNAYEVASSLSPNHHLPITVISFGAPQVGNKAFREKMNAMKVKILRVAVKQDMVPTLPGQLFHKIHEKVLLSTTGKLRWTYQKLISIPGVRKLVSRYQHVGEELLLDSKSSPYLRRPDELCFIGCHNLEVYLHLVDGFHSKHSAFQGSRDIALVNKNTGMLIETLGIPDNWYEAPDKKGLVFNATSGTWVKPCTDH